LSGSELCRTFTIIRVLLQHVVVIARGPISIFEVCMHERACKAQKVKQANQPAWTGMSNWEFLYCMSTEIAIALQKGNAVAFYACCQEAVARAELVPSCRGFLCGQQSLFI